MRPIDGRHVLLALMGFFGVMFAVNGVFVYLATTTFSGLSTKEAYRKGLHYNDTIARHQAVQATGWQHRVRFEGSSIVVTVTLADGRPALGLAITGRLGRPASDAADREIAFRAEAGGAYVAETSGLAAGQWQMIATIDPGPESGRQPYDVAARLWSKP